MKKKTEKLLKAMNTEAVFKSVLDNTIDKLREGMGGLDNQFTELYWTKLKEEAHDYEEINKILASAYEELLTEEELNGLSDFLETPIGKAYAAKMPELNTRLGLAGMEWGEKLAKRLIDSVETEIAALSAGKPNKYTVN